MRQLREVNANAVEEDSDDDDDDDMSGSATENGEDAPFRPPEGLEAYSRSRPWEADTSIVLPPSRATGATRSWCTSGRKAGTPLPSGSAT